METQRNNSITIVIMHFDCSRVGTGRSYSVL